MKNKGEGLARWLIQRAARTAPPLLAQRLEEEWLADLESRRNMVARLRLGVGCCWATRVIAHEHCVASVAAAAAATGSRTVVTYAQHDETYFSRRSASILIIVGLHLAIVYAFVSGLGPKVIKTLVPDMVVVPFEDHPIDRKPPPLQVVKEVERLQGIQPPPIPDLGSLPAIDPIPEKMTIATAMSADIGGPEVTTAPSVKRLLGGPGKNFPATDDYYPADAIRKGQEGTAIVRTCVDERGRLYAVPTLSGSSGFPSLDEGALRLAKAGSGHYRPTTENGQPVSSCYEYRVTYHVKR